MSTEIKALHEDVQRLLADVRSQKEDSASIAQLDALTDKVIALQESVAAKQTVTVIDGAVQNEERMKSEVGEFFTDLSFKADGDLGAVTVAAQGGYQLNRTFNDDVDGIIRKNSPLRRLAKVLDGGLGFVTNIKTSKGTAGQRGEFDPLTASAAPTYEQLIHTFQEINSTEAITMWADLNPTARIDFAQSVMQDVAEAMAEQESNFFMTGTIQNPRASGSTALKNGLLKQTKLVANVDQYTNVIGSMAGVETATTGVVTPDDIISLLFSLHAGYDANTSVLTSREVVKVILTAKDDNHRYLLDISGVPGSPAVRVLGKELIVSDYFPAIASAANVPVAVAGDFRKGVTIVDASPVRWNIDPYTDKRMRQFTGARLTSSAIVNHNALRGLYIKPSA